jgi:DNA-binding response OmpR family regulator
MSHRRGAARGGQQTGVGHSAPRDRENPGTRGAATEIMIMSENELPTVPPLVLLGEDDLELRRLLTERLRRLGVDVVAVRDGRELLRQIRGASTEDPPALVISDLRMPFRTGLDVLSVMREAGGRIPFILITAFGDAETHVEAHRLGATVFDKPFDLDDLCAAVEFLLHARR